MFDAGTVMQTKIFSPWFWCLAIHLFYYIAFSVLVSFCWPTD